MCGIQSCGNCQQKHNPTPQQIRRFPFLHCQLHKKQWAALMNLPLLHCFLFFQIACQQIHENLNFMTFAEERFKAQMLSRKGTDIHRDPEDMLLLFPHNPKHTIESFREKGDGVRHSSETWLLDCSILNEEFFSGDHWSLPGEQCSRLLLCGSLQGAEDKKNEKWHWGSWDMLFFQSIVYLDFLSSSEVENFTAKSFHINRITVSSEFAPGGGVNLHAAFTYSLTLLKA